MDIPFNNHLLISLNNKYRELAIKEFEAVFNLSSKNYSLFMDGDKAYIITGLDLPLSLFQDLALVKFVNRIGLPKSFSRRIIHSSKVRNIDINIPYNKNGPLMEFFFFNNESIPSFRIYTNPNDYRQRLPHNMPGLFPATIHPLIARAMVNLSKSSSQLFDPFVGTGGIVIEALLMNKSMAGIDIDPLMINRAKKRLSFLNLKTDLWVSDATTISLQEILEHTGWSKINAIVTEPPFGKNSKKVDLFKLYSSFLSNFDYVSRIVFSLPDIKLFEELSSSFKLELVYSQYIHKSMSRHIVIR